MINLYKHKSDQFIYQAISTIDYFRNMFNDRVEYSLVAATVLLSTFVAMFDSIIWAIVLVCFYSIGLLWGTKLMYFVGMNINKESNDKIDNNRRDSCGVCGSNQCKRHRRSPHLNTVQVPKDFDLALEQLLEEILQRYVGTWYSDLSSSEAFIQQLRLAITNAARNVTSRLYRADISNIIFEYLIPVAVRHAQDWQELVKRSKSLGGKPSDYISSYLGSKVHPAAFSREAELNHLRGIVNVLMPQLLPATHISTNNKVILREVLANWVLLPALDALADPDIINTLIILSTYHEGKFSQLEESLHVPMLQSWLSSPTVVPNVVNTLKPSLEEVLNDPKLLYMFMNHIKDTGPVNLLQFYLDIDDLSKRMLNPEITPEIEENLYSNAKNIYSAYLDPESAAYLHLPLYISQGMQQILEGGPSKIQELRISRPLYQAHQEAHALLENTCLPSFHHSYDMYKLLCGVPNVSNVPAKPSGQNSNISSGFSVGAKLSTQLGKIRGVLRASAVEGAPFHSHHVYQAEEVNCSPRTCIGDNSECATSSRDLTTWRVTVPHVDGGGTQPLYMVSVHSVAEDKSWTVLRRDQDFYALRARLAEFHGDRELNDSPLPTRKNQHPSLTANRQRYQDFLQKLLAKPTLRSSELLHTFLTSSNLKASLSNNSTPDIGVLYQSMAHKLRKERGQHLDKFMSTFLTSTNVKYDHTDLGIDLASDQILEQSQKRGRDLISLGPFSNNLNLDPQIQNFPYVPNKREHAKGACYCITEALDSLVISSPSVSRIFWMVASIFRQRLDPFIYRWFHDVLTTLLSGGRAAIVVNRLHATIFDDSSSETVSDTKSNQEYYKAARSGLHNILPRWFFGLHSKWCELMDTLHEPLQNASFNKHLAYALVDQLLLNLFPELTS